MLQRYSRPKRRCSAMAFNLFSDIEIPKALFGSRHFSVWRGEAVCDLKTTSYTWIGKDPIIENVILLHFNLCDCAWPYWRTQSLTSARRTKRQILLSRCLQKWFMMLMSMWFPGLFKAVRKCHLIICCQILMDPFDNTNLCWLLSHRTYVRLLYRMCPSMFM